MLPPTVQTMFRRLLTPNRRDRYKRARAANVAAWVLVILTAMLTTTLAAQDLEQSLGRSVFVDGQGRDGRAVIGRVAGGTVPMRGGAVACGNCHGSSGAGGSEGWVEAPDIRWFALSKPYGARRAGGAARPPYDRVQFARMLRTGKAVDGIELDPAMPRFDLADDEVDALVDYLTLLNDGPQRNDVRPALVLLMPETPTLASQRLLTGLQTCPLVATDGASVPRTLPALRVVRYRDPDQINALLSDMARDGSAAALFAPYLVGAEDAFARAGAGGRLPVLLPMAMGDLGDTSQIVFALPGLRAQAQALIAPPLSATGQRLAITIDPAMPGAEALLAHLRVVAEGMGWLVQAYNDSNAALAGAPDAMLAIAAPGNPPASLPAGFRLWVPAMHLQPAMLQAWAQAGAEVRIALPYPPTADGDRRWIPPADAWVAAGCELMSRLPPLPAHREGIDTWRAALSTQPPMQLGEWLHLPAQATDSEAAGRVFLSRWPPGGP